MPSRSKSQQALAAMDLERKRAGKKPKTDMSEQQLMDFAETPTKKLPKRAKKEK